MSNKSKQNKKTDDKPLNPMAKLALQRLKLVEAENARIKALQDEVDRKIREEHEAIERKNKEEDDERKIKLKIKQDKIQSKKDAGTYKTKAEKEKVKINKDKLEQLKNSGISIGENGIIVNKVNKITYNSDDEDDDEIVYDLKAPIITIMGHVDTGKTKLLDKIRDTNVQEGEVGGITQQIGATFIPKDTLIIKSKLNKSEINLPGILMIDTPGHEAFANLRSRGSSLCDIAIIVIDIVHGLEQQTIESINMVRDLNIHFIFALNKIDRLYGWTTIENKSIHDSLKENSNCINEFNDRLNNITCQIMSLGLNVKLFWENNSIIDTISICPISAKTGEGICDLLSVIINTAQYRLTEHITYKDTLKCIIMEKTITEGIGSSIDVILINGELKKGDEISFQTNEGICKTTIRSLLTPPPNRESRVKSEFIHHESLRGSMGIKIVGTNLDKAIVGSQIVFEEESINIIPINTFTLQDNGITVFSSTQGSLEALIHFLQNECKPSVPIYSANIGKITKKDIIKMIKIDKKEFLSILAFNIEVDDDILEFAGKNSIKIFTAEIIYHLFDQYIKYRDQIINERKNKFRGDLVLPCSLKILEKNIYNKKNPLIFGVTIMEGNLHINTPLAIPELNIYLGKVISIQLDGKDVIIGKQGTTVCIKVENNDNPITYGRQFDHKNILYSMITRKSIDILKEYFKDEATIEDAKLLIKFKKLFNII